MGGSQVQRKRTNGRSPSTKVTLDHGRTVKQENTRERERMKGFLQAGPGAGWSLESKGNGWRRRADRRVPGHCQPAFARPCSQAAATAPPGTPTPPPRSQLCGHESTEEGKTVQVLDLDSYRLYIRTKKAGDISEVRPGFPTSPNNRKLKAWLSWGPPESPT